MFPERYSVMVVGAPDAGVLDFCVYLASFYLRDDQNVVFIETDTSSTFLRRQLRIFGITPEDCENHSLRMIDCFSEPKGEEDQENLSSPSDLPGLLEKIRRMIDPLENPVRVIFDSLSSLHIHNSADEIRTFLEKLIQITKNKGSLTVTLHEGMHPVEHVVALTSQCDGLIEMKVDERMDRYIRINRMKNLPVKPRWVLFEPDLSEAVSGTSLIWKK